MAGVFFILVGGIVVAAVTCLGEYVAKQISKNIKKVRVSFYLKSAFTYPLDSKCFCYPCAML